MSDRLSGQPQRADLCHRTTGSRVNTVTRRIDEILVRLRYLRLGAELSQTDIAQKIGPTVYHSSVSEWETGKSSPTLARLRPWAEALGCRVVLLEGAASPPGSPLSDENTDQAETDSGDGTAVSGHYSGPESGHVG